MKKKSYIIICFSVVSRYLASKGLGVSCSCEPEFQGKTERSRGGLLLEMGKDFF